MTFEQIQKANSTLSTMDIKGKDYVLVNERIKAFRMLHPEGDISTELLSNNDGVCVFKATVYDEEGRRLGTGHAYEKESSSYINKTSYIENCETSAVGRALGMCGIGIDTAVASYEEVSNAIRQQEATNTEPVPPITERQKGCIAEGVKRHPHLEAYLRMLLSDYGVTKTEELTKQQASDVIDKLKERADGSKGTAD